ARARPAPRTGRSALRGPGRARPRTGARDPVRGGGRRRIRGRRGIPGIDRPDRPPRRRLPAAHALDPRTGAHPAGRDGALPRPRSRDDGRARARRQPVPRPAVPRRLRLMNMADSTAGAPPRPVPVAVFASGGGSNLQAILNHLAGPAGSVARVALVVSDKADAGALERARRAGVPTRVIPVRDRPGAEVASEMLDALAAAGARMIALAGY